MPSDSPNLNTRPTTGALASGRTAAWFERLYSRLGIPFWVGAVVSGGILLFGLNIAAYLAAGTWGDSFTSGQLSVLPVVSVSGVLFQFAALFNTRRVEKLRRHAESMSGGGPQVNLQSLYRLRGVLLCWAFLTGLFIPTYTLVGLPAQYSLLQKLIIDMPFVYYFLIVATYLWIWGYSMYAVYLIGKLPMRLKPFTEDRALGLMPFGSASLRLTAIYLGILAFSTLPQEFFGNPFPLPALVFVGGLFLLAPIFFLIPLFPLRSKLRASRQELSSLVAPRYTQAFEEFRAGRDNASNEELVGELVSIDKIQRDIHRIHSWPIDTGMLVKLTAVVLSIIAIMTTKILSILFGI